MPDDITTRLADALRKLFDGNSVHPSVHAERAREVLAAFDAQPKAEPTTLYQECALHGCQMNKPAGTGFMAQPPAAFDEKSATATFNEFWGKYVENSKLPSRISIAEGRALAHAFWLAALSEQSLAARRQSGQGGG